MRLPIHSTFGPASFDHPISFTRAIRQTANNNKHATGMFLARSLFPGTASIRAWVSTGCLQCLIIILPDVRLLCTMHVRVVIMLSAHVIRARGRARRQAAALSQ